MPSKAVELSITWGDIHVKSLKISYCLLSRLFFRKLSSIYRLKNMAEHGIHPRRNIILFINIFHGKELLREKTLNSLAMTLKILIRKITFLLFSP